MDLRRADLHLHTTVSDGKRSPADLVAHVRAHGLAAVAVTDHDTVDGLAEAAAAGARLGVEVVTGVELSVTVDAQEIHLLGYFFDPTHAALRRHLEAFRHHRTVRARAIVERLNALGVPLTMEAVLAEAGGGALGRPHVARALVAGGYVPTYQDAFLLYLRDDAAASVPKPRFPAEQALAMLHDAGGIGVLAHPGHWMRDAVLMALIRAGLDGIETVHPSHDVLLTGYYRQIARDFGLLETGGSDYHGGRPEDDENLGRYSIPYGQLETLRRRTAA